jgi:hypothetical protein
MDLGSLPRITPHLTSPMGFAGRASEHLGAR